MLRLLGNTSPQMKLISLERDQFHLWASVSEQPKQSLEMLCNEWVMQCNVEV